ncbi:MAG: hypothetical protein ABL894_02580 [Hyphomicrobium sp.]
MHPMKKMSTMAMAFWACGTLLTTATLAEATAPANPLETCRKAVNLLGASMGHADVKDAHGRPAYRFLLRTSGMDYEATCDAQTGIVGDISPRRTGETAPL